MSELSEPLSTLGTGSSVNIDRASGFDESDEGKPALPKLIKNNKQIISSTLYILRDWTQTALSMRKLEI